MRGAVTLVLALSFLAAAVPATGERGTHDENGIRVPAVPGPGIILTSSGTVSSLAARETAGPDTFALYGGPDHPTEGKFQLGDGVTPDWGGGNGLPGGYGGGPDAWTPVDRTDFPIFWHKSQFNAQTLGTNQPSPNHAMWSGVEAGDPLATGWVVPPGYGNNWNDGLIYESAPVADPAAGQVVAMDFYFHHETEYGFDYFNVQYDSAGIWTTVLSVDGSDRDGSDFVSPGVLFSELQSRQIAFSGNDYGGDNGDQIRIRMLVTSDGAWSDEDGLFPTDGAAQVDQITLTTSEGSYSEDFEGAGPYLFAPDKAPFAGDFAEVFALMTDTDPCVSDNSPVVGFMDYGQTVRNGPGTTGVASTGGSTSLGVQYGIPGNFVVNYTGGLSLGEAPLFDEIWSPDIVWDLPGPEDDGADVAGAFIRFDVWNDLPVINGIFFIWYVRSESPSYWGYTQWKSRNFVYHGVGYGYWSTQTFDVSDLLLNSPDHVQMSLGVLDYADVFGFPGTAGRPSPVFDNVSFSKYRLQGPTFATRNIDLAQDGFPVSGSIDVSSPATRDALDVPFDMARDTSSGVLNTPGDSVIVDVAATIPGSTVSDIRMVWALYTNPLFEDDLRSEPARVKDENVVAGAAGTVWTGEVVADTCKTYTGAIVQGRFFVDLPDQDFLYPGDLLHYYIEATDSDGRVSTFPANTDGFMDFTPGSIYSRTFTVRALPSITDVAGAQPELLVINDFGHRGGEDEFTSTFQQIGYLEGVDYDTYTVQGPSSRVGNGIGSAGAHGANGDQLGGYHHVFYFAGNLANGLLESGSDSYSWGDAGDDVGTMEAWYALPGARNGAWFGDYIAYGMTNDSSSSLNFLTSTLGVELIDLDVRDAIGGQTAPRVIPSPAGESWFVSDFIAYGGCPGINQFDWILPLAGAEAGHYFATPEGQPYDDGVTGVASVIHPVTNGVNITFPYSTQSIQDVRVRAVQPSALKWLFEGTLSLFNAGIAPSIPVGAPQAARVSLSVEPNPFNPSTLVRFTTPLGSRGSVRVYNLRGERVRTLHTGEFQSQEFLWDGTDDRGSSVASGVYVVRAEADGSTQAAKVALVK